ncbi:MAG: hypothetical protein JEY79_19390, partial [Pseudodesulfovibrio sp.]|nr:hypothetical protein [Pseudodesulfovibrio sp.]
MKTTVQINLRIDPELKARALEAAQENYQTSSLTAFIVQAIEEKIRRDYAVKESMPHANNPPRTKSDSFTADGDAVYIPIPPPRTKSGSTLF